MYSYECECRRGQGLAVRKGDPWGYDKLWKYGNTIRKMLVVFISIGALKSFLLKSNPIPDDSKFYP